MATTLTYVGWKNWNALSQILFIYIHKSARTIVIIFFPWRQYLFTSGALRWLLVVVLFALFFNICNVRITQYKKYKIMQEEKLGASDTSLHDTIAVLIGLPILPFYLARLLDLWNISLIIFWYFPHLCLNSRKLWSNLYSTHTEFFSMVYNNHTQDKDNNKAYTL